MADIKLKPCPFCGSKAEFVTTTSGYQNDSRIIGFQIRCTKCKIEYPKRYEVRVSLGRNGEIITDLDQRKEAVDAWNNRKTE